MSTDKNTKHSYFSHYKKIFHNFNSNDKLNILEIGVQTGGGLLYLSKFFVNSTIYGLDIDFSHFKKNILNNKNIKVIENNAYDKEFINSTFLDNNIKFELIIDDGPHDIRSQLFAIENYSKLLKNNGYLIIEDVALYERVGGRGTCGKKKEKNLFDYISNEFKLKYEIKLLDLTNEKNRFDNALIILHHRTFN